MNPRARGSARTGTETLGTASAADCGMVRLTVRLNATSARTARELLDALRFLVVGTRLEPGCLECSAWTDPDGKVHYVEQWATEADMRQRVRSDGFTSLLVVIEAATDPQVQFDFVTKTRGLDYVAQVRSDSLP
jgi:quinol monooxygenase YgiN